MDSNSIIYVPCLRWKQGEYQAVLNLSAKTKKVIKPLIEIPEVGWDFEEKKNKKTIDQLLSPFAKRVYEKWGTESCFVDVMKHIQYTDRMSDGVHPEAFVFKQLRDKKCTAIPVVSLEKDQQHLNEISKILTVDQRGICFRLTIEEAAKNSITAEMDAILSKLSTKQRHCYIILDLRSPNYIPIDSFVLVLHEIIKRFPYLTDWRSFAILGTSFPETMAGFNEGIETVPRYEWQLYKKLVANLKKAKLRVPNYGDYTISHPNITTMDMRMIKPAATIRYTIEDYWCIVKGTSFRDNRKQYHDLCKKLVHTKYYDGEGYSFGDEYIKKCADKINGCGNLTTWRNVGTNHHVERVVQEIANFYASGTNL